MSKRKYALCGLSTRAIYHFAIPILGVGRAGGNDFSDICELAGILDLDFSRVADFLGQVQRVIPVYAPGEMRKMIEETGATTVLVATPDHLHCENIIDALEAGCNIIVEKPMAISTAEVRLVQEAEKRTGRSVTVAFNYRYAPRHQIIKRMISDGRLGAVTNVEFTYNLDTFHGASYFYRWNRERAKSGGLNIHKCCHHFDLINWLIGDQPEQVFAFGRLNYYGPEGALRPRDAAGLPLGRIEEKSQCPIFQKHYAGTYDAAQPAVDPGWDEFHLPAEAQYPASQPRYIYDPEIDIEDTYSVVFRYSRGASLSYSCNFCTPWEGYRLGINGTKGRIEVEHRTNPDPTGLSPSLPGDNSLTFFPLFGDREDIQIPEVSGGHDGADPMIQRDLFAGESQNSLALGLVAGSAEGGFAVSMGEAVWLSIRDGKPIRLAGALHE